MSENSNPESAASLSSVPNEQPKTVVDVVREIAPEALNKIPDDKKELLAGLVIEKTTHIRSVRSAPLPEPSELAAYSQIIPNGADRIMKMAEAQTAHRIQIEKTVIFSQKNQAFRGQVFGLIVGLGGLSLATYAAMNGHDWFGGAIGSGTLVSLVYVFVQSREKQEEELGDKRQQMQQSQQVPQRQNPKKKNRNK
ncbi:MAG TPA: DUF2335 domain-containing protein [Verrucomicrobiae bacterium]|jgi:uncharacterized membrane protein